MARIVLFAATTGYQVRVFAEAAKSAGIELVLATDRCHVLDDPWGDDAAAVRFEDPLAAAAAIQARGPFDGAIAVGDKPAVAASRIAERLGLRFHPPAAAIAATNKFLARERFKAAGLLTPDFQLNSPPSRYPCVVKPLGLSASRGVIRADNESGFALARARIHKMIEHQAERSIQVEDFIPGREFALEGVVTRGRLRVLALFDKPDPLDGPFFEETIYVTPSREPESAQVAMSETAQRAITALGLTDGPVHAEMRVNDRGAWMLEAAPRPIGGLCARVLRFENGVPLEEFLLRHAAGEDVWRLHLEPGAHGVMMIPTPGAGVFSGVDGMESACAVAGIEDVVITAKQGQALVPLPEGSSYPGFIFAHAGTSREVEWALREAHSRLKFQLAEALPVVR